MAHAGHEHWFIKIVQVSDQEAEKDCTKPTKRAREGD